MAGLQGPAEGARAHAGHRGGGTGAHAVRAGPGGGGDGRRSPAMDERELQAKAEHYKRIASLVTDEDISTALLELAAKYEAMAKSLRIEPPDRRE